MKTIALLLKYLNILKLTNLGLQFFPRTRHSFLNYRLKMRSVTTIRTIYHMLRGHYNKLRLSIVDHLMRGLYNKLLCRCFYKLKEREIAREIERLIFLH